MYGGGGGGNGNGGGGKNKTKQSLENLISKYEQRNFELEEREIEAKQRLSMIEAAMPAIVAWNVYHLMNNGKLIEIKADDKMSKNSIGYKKNGGKNTTGGAGAAGIGIEEEEDVVVKKLEQLLNDQKKLRENYEKVETFAADREKILLNKIDELELRAAKDRETLEDMTNTLKALKDVEKTDSTTLSSSSSSSPPPSSYRSNNQIINPEEMDLFKELKGMIANEIQLRAELERYEKKEQAYMESLEKADEIWANMEADYKNRLSDAETINENLQKRVKQLEETQKELEKALDESRTLKNDEEKEEETNEKKTKQSEEEEMINNNNNNNKHLYENDNLKFLEFQKNLDKKFEEQKKFLEMENISLKEELKILKSDFMREDLKYVTLQKELEAAKKEAILEKELAENMAKTMQERKDNFTAIEKNLQNTKISKIKIFQVVNLENFSII